MSTRVRSHAKINLGLFLGAPRADGFHSLVTVYQTLESHDIVTVMARPAAESTIRISSNDDRVPTDSHNTAWKMVSLALDQIGVRAAVEIHIDKRLPVQGGLGAGSGNAVAALVGLGAELEKQGSGMRDQGSELRPEWPRQQGSKEVSERVGEPASQPAAWPGGSSGNAMRFVGRRQFEIAAKVGSDVPLFLVGGAVLGVDRGQEVYPLPDIEPAWCVVAVPEVGISTPQAFRDWDSLCVREGLTAEASAVRLEKSSRAYASAFRGEVPEGGFGTGSSGVFSLGEDLAGPQEMKQGSGLVRTGIMSWIENDFERVVFPQHPSLAVIKRILAASDTPEAALYTSLSGSGSALFGLYLTRGDAEAAKGRVESQAPGTQAHVTQTLPRHAYWDQMIVKDSY